LGDYGVLKEAKKPVVGTGIFFFKSSLHTFLRNKQLKFPRPFFKEPILIRVKHFPLGPCFCMDFEFAKTFQYEFESTVSVTLVGHDLALSSAL
jgi:hypothetical protein